MRVAVELQRQTLNREVRVNAVLAAVSPTNRLYLTTG
jgi:hypothetical protein